MVTALLLLAALAAAPRDMPDPARTPGVTRDLSVRTICTTKWGTDARHVTEAMKTRVAAAYDIPWIPKRAGHRFTVRELAIRHDAGEADHLIPRELGGADDEHNLWFQPWEGTWNAHMKDRLENNLHVRVCAGTLSLQTARRAIATNWKQAYLTYVDSHVTADSTPWASAAGR